MIKVFCDRCSAEIQIGVIQEPPDEMKISFENYCDIQACLCQKCECALFDMVDGYISQK